MIDKSVVERLAIQCGIDLTEIEFLRHEATEGYFISVEDVQTFAQAVIENYKASLVPAAWQFLDGGEWFTGSVLNNHKKNTINGGCEVREIYALPSGETK